MEGALLKLFADYKPNTFFYFLRVPKQVLKKNSLNFISVLSGYMSMPDATSLHHCLQNHHQYCTILS